MTGHLAEPPLARAGDICEDPVIGDALGQVQGVSGHRKHAGVRKPRQVAAERLKPGRGAVDGDDGTPIAHPLGQVRGLAARGRTEVEHGIPWLRPKEGGGQTGGHLLDVKEPEPVLERLGQGKGGRLDLVNPVAQR